MVKMIEKFMTKRNNQVIDKKDVNKNTSYELSMK